MKWNEQYSAHIHSVFPTDTTNKVITVTPVGTGIVVSDTNGDDSNVKGFIKDNGITVNDGVKTSETYGSTNKSFGNGSVTYAVKDSSSDQNFNIYLSNSYVNGNRDIFSNNPDANTSYVKVQLSYTDTDGVTKYSEEKFLKVSEFEHAEPLIYQTSNYPGSTIEGSKNSPLLVVAGESYNSSRSGEYLLETFWYVNGNKDNLITKFTYLPLKSVTIQVRKTKELILELDKDKWSQVGTSVDNGDGTETITLSYNKGVENFIASQRTPSGQDSRPSVNFAPTVTIPSGAEADTVYELSVMSVTINQYENYTVSNDSATGTVKAYTYSGDTSGTPLSSAYYKTSEFTNPFVQNYVMGSNNSLAAENDGKNYGDYTLGDISWYNSEYPDTIETLGYFGVGNSGTIDYTSDVYVDMKFDSEWIGVKGIRLPLSTEDTENAVKNGLEVRYKLNNATEFTTTIVYNLPKSVWNKWGYVYVDYADLGLTFEDDNYITEFCYKMTSIPAPTSYTTVEKGKVSNAGVSDFGNGLFFGVIKKYTQGQKFENTIQLYSDADLTQELTGQGKSIGVLSNEKRVNYQVRSDAGFITQVNESKPEWYKNPADGTEDKSTIVVSKNDKLHYSGKIYGNNASGWTSRDFGWTPLTRIFIRDIFGTEIENLTIYNNLTGNYLVKDGVAQQGVTLTKLTQTNEVETNGYTSNVYEIVINHKQTVNYYDNCIGQYNGLNNNNSTGLQDAQLEISFDTYVPSNFEAQNTDGTFVHADDVYYSYDFVWAEADCGTETGDGGNLKQLHNKYDQNEKHTDAYDVNNDGITADQTSTEKCNNITRSMDYKKLILKTPEAKSGVILESSFTELENKDDNDSYRSYDENQKERSTVDLVDSDAMMRFLIMNCPTKDGKAPDIKNFELYIIIPKEGENWGKYSNNEDFKFTVNLTGELSNPWEADESTKGLFKVSYAKITPATTGDNFIKDSTGNAYTYETFDSTKASEYNCIKISCAQLPKGSVGESYNDQLSRMKYFTAPVSYGSNLPKETLYDIYLGAAYYTTYTNEESNFNDWYTTNTFGLRADVPSFTAEVNVENGGHEDSTTTPTYGTDFTTKVTPNEGYKVDTSKITVTIGGKPFTEWTYDPETGIITVPGENVTGNIVVTVPCETIKITASGVDTYAGVEIATSDGTGTHTDIATITVSKKELNYQESVSATVTIKNPNFTLDTANVKVEIGGTEIGTDKFTVTKNDAGTGSSSTGGQTGLIRGVRINKENETSSTESWTIKVNGSEVTDDVKFIAPVIPSVDSETTLKNGKTITREDGTTVTDSTTTENVAVDGADPYKTSDYEITVTSDEDNGYVLPKEVDLETYDGTQAITVKVAGEEIKITSYTPVVDVNGRITSAKITVPGQSLLNTKKLDYEIDVICSPYFATNTVKNGTYDAKTEAPFNKDYVSVITPDSGYVLPSDKSKITVTVDGKPFTEFTYENGTVTIPRDKITGDIVIKAECTKKPNPTPTPEPKKVTPSTGTYQLVQTSVTTTENHTWGMMISSIAMLGLVSALLKKKHK